MFYLSVFLLVILLLFQLNSVQTLLATKVLERISGYTDYSISLDKVRISWLDNAEFQDLLIYDLSNDSMIYSKNLAVKYDLIKLLRGQYLQVDEVSAEDLLVNLTKRDSLTKLNLTSFLESFASKSSGTAQRKKSKPIYVEHIHFDQLDFRFTNESKERVPSKVDFSHLDLAVPVLDISDFQLRSDTILGSINHFAGAERNSAFEIEEFKADFSLSNKALDLDNVLARTPTSTISDSLQFFYNGLDDFGYFIDSVSFAFHLNNTRISSQDLQLVAGISQISSDLLLDGVFWGTVGDFNIEDSRIGFGSATYFKGGVSCFGLPDLSKTFILADIVDSRLLPQDLEPYIGDFSNNLGQMGRIDFSGSFAGFLNDFVAKGDFDTDQGALYSDINIKIPDDPTMTYYKGNLELENVNIGALLKSKLIQKVSLNGSIEGTGITPDNADFNLNAMFYKSGLNGYVYDSVFVDGHFEKNFFKSRVAINDPYCQLEGNAELDLREESQFLDFDINAEKVLADKLNLTGREISGTGKIDLSIENFDLDQFTGDLTLDSAMMKINGNLVPLNSVKISSSFAADSTRKITLTMPGVETEVQGDFKITSLIDDLVVLGNGYATKLQLSEAIDLDSLEKLSSGENYKIESAIKLLDINPYLDSLQIPVHVAKGSFLEVSFRHGRSSHVSLFFESDSVKVYENRFDQPLVEVNGSSRESLNGILTNFIFTSSKQYFKGIPETTNLLLEGIWFDDAIELSTLIAQPSSSTDIRLESQLRLSEDSIEFRVKPSDIVILDDQWNFNPSNRIIIASGDIGIRNFEIYDQSEAIHISGNVSSMHESTVRITVEDLNMDKANLFSDVNFGGFLNGSFELIRDEPSQPMSYDGDFFLKNLAYDDILIGDLNGSSQWDPINRSVYSNVEVNRDNFKSIELKGYYYPARGAEQFDFQVAFNQADLKMASPFVQENVSDLSGFASGQIQLLGNLKSPNILGSFQVDGSGKIIYLNTAYSFSGGVNFDTNAMRFSDFSLVDRKGNSADIEGQIMHQFFAGFSTNISMSTENFEFLNTTSLDNKLYYGSAYGTGDISITGPFNDLVIKADVKTEPNTRLFIPVSESTNASQEDFIQFVNFSDSTFTVAEEKTSSINGLTLDFDMEITPDAYCELIFDIKKGDIIRGRGRGNIKLSLSTDGSFDMFGPLEITEGAYNFTLSNFINKEFDVVPGSSITWYGDPYDASLNLEATYLQRASFDELEVLSNSNGNQASNRVPILAVLFIDGSILTPEIGFGLRLENESDANTDNIGKLSRIVNDEQELRRQFISLLFLRKFSPYESFSLGSGQGIGGSVSEILSNQVSYLVSQIDENLEVEVDLASLDEESFNTFQLRFAYTFLDGRLKVTRGGGFGNEQAQKQNVLNDIVGDWSVEYSLTKDGRLRAKVFRNTNERLITNDGNQSQETGISLRFVHSFNDLTELLSSRREEAIRKREKGKNNEKKSNSTSNLDQSTN